MARPGFFTALAVLVGAILVVRLVRRAPLLAGRARRLTVAESTTVVVADVLLVFHCAAMFATGWVAAIGVLDVPAAIVSDLSDPIGRVAYWLPAVALLIAVRRLWWPAPVGLALALAAVGWTMYGSFTVDQHLATIAVAVTGIAITVAGLVEPPSRNRPGRPAVVSPA